MEPESKLSKIFLINPFKRGMVEWFVLIGTGICGLLFSWQRLSIFPITNIFGGFMILFAFLFHLWAEKDHKQAHENSDEIEMIVTSGVYSRIRHPLYLSLIILNIGIAISFGGLIVLILAMLTIVHWCIASYQEEEALLMKFRDDYAQYKKTVRWRMVPGVF